MSLTLAGATALVGGLAAAGSAAGITAQAASNKGVARLQNEFNLNMWRMTNEYNHPVAQMERLAEAGLNPNLIYGQGSPGNASSSPHMVAPTPPDYQGQLSKLGKIFNIEQLMLLDSQVKKAQEEARVAELERFDKEDQRIAEANFGDLWQYDQKTGRYIPNSFDVETVAPNPRGSRPGDRFTTNARFNQLLLNSDKNWLLPHRAFLLHKQGEYLVPQISMANYESKNYPYSYWIGQGTKIAKGLSDVTGIFNPTRYLMPIGKSRQFVTPTGRVLSY